MTLNLANELKRSGMVNHREQLVSHPISIEHMKNINADELIHIKKRR